MAQEHRKRREQAAYRKVVRKTWRKQSFRDEPPEMQLFLLYLWTGPDATTPGMYYISPGTIADDLETDVDTVRQRLQNGIGNGWFHYDEKARVIFFPKWTEYDPPANKNTVISYMRQLLDLPNSPLSRLYADTLEPYIKRYGVPLPQPYVDRFRCPSPSPLPSPSLNKTSSYCAPEGRTNVDNPVENSESDSKPKYTPEDDIRRNNLRSILKKVGTWRCMERQNNPYSIAQKILDLFDADNEFCLLFLERKSEVLKITNDGGHLLGTLTKMKWQDSQWHEIQSESHREPDRVERI